MSKKPSKGISLLIPSRVFRERTATEHSSIIIRNVVSSQVCTKLCAYNGSGGNCIIGIKDFKVVSAPYSTRWENVTSQVEHDCLVDCPHFVPNTRAKLLSFSKDFNKIIEIPYDE